MNFIFSSSQDPYFNLATEEYLLKQTSDNFVLFYVNQPCVVVGKHQNTLKEIDSRYIYDNKILIARRLSGGGAVYHDEGNLNFSFIQSILPGESASYQTITKTLFDFLKTTIPNLVLTERNDFRVEDKKVSGSAMHIYKNRVLAHGTLLIDCNLTHLSAALKGEVSRFQDKAISSVKSSVKNLSKTYINLDINLLTANFESFLRDLYPVHPYTLPLSQIGQVEELALSKYSQRDWIFGYSPKYSYSNHFSFKGRTIGYKIEVLKGIIEEIEFEKEDQEANIYHKFIGESLIGKEHNPYALFNTINSMGSEDFREMFIESLF
jgi:lipoate-protein ligase A